MKNIICLIFYQKLVKEKHKAIHITKINSFENYLIFKMLKNKL